MKDSPTGKYKTAANPQKIIDRVFRFWSLLEARISWSKVFVRSATSWERAGTIDVWVDCFGDVEWVCSMLRLHLVIFLVLPPGDVTSESFPDTNNRFVPKFFFGFVNIEGGTSP